MAISEIDEQAVYPVAARHLYSEESTLRIEPRVVMVFTLEIDRAESLER